MNQKPFVRFRVTTVPNGILVTFGSASLFELGLEADIQKMRVYSTLKEFQRALPELLGMTNVTTLSDEAWQQIEKAKAK